MRRLLALAAFALFTILHAGNSLAESKATPLARDSRLVTFGYDQDNTYLVLTRRGDVTRLQLGEDEEIVTLAAGDTKSFNIKPTNDGKNVLIKATFDNVTSSMSLITSKRTYEIILKSTFEGGRWYQRVQWEYPEIIAADFSRRKSEEAKALLPEPPAATALTAAGLRVEDLNFDYSIDGDAPFRPAQVFDDGVFTYLRMPERIQELPALFAVADGDLALVNFIADGPYLKAQRIMQEMLLKSGKTEVRIKRGRSGGLFGFGG